MPWGLLRAWQHSALLCLLRLTLAAHRRALAYRLTLQMAIHSAGITLGTHYITSTLSRAQATALSST